MLDGGLVKTACFKDPSSNRVAPWFPGYMSWCSLSLSKLQGQLVVRLINNNNNNNNNGMVLCARCLF